MNNKFNLKKITLIGVMAATVFVASQIQINIPAGFGITRLHIGNGFCLLAGLVLGPLAGGLAAGMGSAFFDILSPIYFWSAPFTFTFKFIMAYLAGKIAWSMGSKAESFNKNLIGSIIGAFTYVALYLCKGYLKNVFVAGMPHSGALAALITKVWVSSVNAIVGVIIAVVLAKVLVPIIRKQGK